MTECLELARPIVRRGASLNADQAWWQLLKESQDRTPLQLAANNHLAASIDRVMAFEKWKAQLHPAEHAKDIARALGRIRYGRG